ncbi:response regulator transcription factor [Pseudomonas tremae]|uniref:LuxR response regulator receiver n=2 Tax=Pseudomonas syringae group TaxID=136849 RepID=A0AB37QRF3_9PSED|nr:MULTISPECIES: response regulator transcription factor [Pseudomonas syringae group]KGS12987.1 LuxR family transcriptional regulator [Pseudomonas coronafaciens]KPB52143.1 LuxR response regulator receiver [Pseudomonas coronafaciens pv. oryzae]KPY04609.1 LuxR response regulator receiver [Pseudomonas coronafaciens pv. oryzae]KPZ21400.1 LuxR response regulator receiver [Pseudomonas coronafaciens pv. zizaniae]MCQ3016435.1 response regulator transcription factor [Pseudomonas tremae]
MSDSTDRPLRVIVADDHPIFLIGLRVVLERHGLANVVAQAHNPDELLQALTQHRCDVLVTDFMMPVEQQSDGLRLLQRIRRDFPALPVVVVTTLSNGGLFQSMLDIGVRGLLSKASLTGELPMAIRSARLGEVFVSDSVRRVLREIHPHGPQPMRPSERLSPKELEVLRLLAAGHTVGQIAAQLNRSKQTVSAQKIGAMRKLGLANDATLFIYLQESGMS